MNENVAKMAKELGYEEKKEYNPVIGYITTLVKGEHEITVSRVGSVEQWYKPDEEIIAQLKAGKPDYDKEFEKMFG